MKAENEILLRYCEQQWNHIRHLEEQRATFTNLVTVIAAGILGFVTQQGLNIQSLPLIILLIILGIAGVIASAKFYERSQLHWKREYFWRNRINELNPNAKLVKLNDAAEEEHSKKRPIMYGFRVHILWVTFHALIALLGIIIAIVIIVK